jgi:mevalonate kinase
MPYSIRASAPGSLMLFGEHAVLHGRRALVAAIDRRVQVTLVPRRDDRVQVRSALAAADTDVHALALPPALRFVGGALAHHRGHLPTGFDLSVESAIDPTLGFGSSAAVTVATLAALMRFRGVAVEPAALLDASVRVIRSVQGRGSGADAAASVHGGFVLYRATPCSAQRLAHTHPLTAFYSGTKVPTPEVIAHVERRRAGNEPLFDALFDAIDACTAAGARAAEASDWARFGAVMDVAQGLMDALGVSTTRLAHIVAALRGSPGVHGAKISGAGLGDCVIALGVVDDGALQPIALDIAQSGVQVDAR